MILGLGRCPGEGNGNPLQYSCLENPTDCSLPGSSVHGVTRVGHDLATKPPPPEVGYPCCESLSLEGFSVNGGCGYEPEWLGGGWSTDPVEHFGAGSSSYGMTRGKNSLIQPSVQKETCLIRKLGNSSSSLSTVPFSILTHSFLCVFASESLLFPLHLLSPAQTFLI